VFSDQEWVSNAVRMRMLENCEIYENKYTSFNTPGMTDYMSTLQTMLDDTIIKIITGQENLAYFDKFVTDWYALGGNTITNEVNEWYKNQ
jgi:putative aldouronate transport system substrate-binding protein